MGEGAGSECELEGEVVREGERLGSDVEGVFEGRVIREKENLDDSELVYYVRSS